ncbi:MAG: biopolymer transporter ExbD [Verrucomicrobia bacterium]|nr:biopolymer transporter ExbD [Verrucomicrobiota bacterium]
MRFTNPKRRQPPAVIIISLIDVLIIMLIFLMVTTTFKQHPALKIMLPETKQAKEGATEGNIVITINKVAPFLFIGTRPVTFERLVQELAAEVKKNPQVTVSIRPDTDATIGKWLNVVDAAKAAGVKNFVYLHAKTPEPR